MWRNKYISRALDICNGLSLLGSHTKDFPARCKTMNNTTRLLSSTAVCTVTFRSRSNITILIGKWKYYGLTLLDYRVVCKFKVSHSRVCDATSLPSANKRRRCWWIGGEGVMRGDMTTSQVRGTRETIGGKSSSSCSYATINQ
jgi:hypothetical protein